MRAPPPCQEKVRRVRFTHKTNSQLQSVRLPSVEEFFNAAAKFFDRFPPKTMRQYLYENKTKQQQKKGEETFFFFFFFFFWWLYFWTAGIRIEQQNQIFHQIEGDSRNTIREAENTRLQLLCSPAWRANNRTEPPTEPPAEPAESFGLILWQVSFSCQRFLCVLFCFFTVK